MKKPYKSAENNDYSVLCEFLKNRGFRGLCNLTGLYCCFDEVEQDAYLAEK